MAGVNRMPGVTDWWAMRIPEAESGGFLLVARAPDGCLYGSLARNLDRIHAELRQFEAAIRQAQD